jgi:NAD(P)-dependent dehydrogenase (short-subunit alcohol dehydrogenase family)
MCLTMARDLGSLGIRVMAIAPSLFRTGGTDEHLTPEWERELTRDAAFPERAGRPDEYARLVQAFLENPMLNGQCVRLDAGTRLAPK